MNTPVSVATRISTIAYTYMGVELIVSGIITIAMHYGIANNPPAAFVVYSATYTPTTLFPVWGGALAIIMGICFIIAGSAIQNNGNTIKGFSLVVIIGGLIQIIAFCFACNSMAATVRYIRLNTGPAAVYNYIPIVFCVVYMVIFLTNTAVCIRSLFLGRMLIRTYTAVVIQPGNTVVIKTDDQTKESSPPDYNNPTISKPAEVA